MGKSILPRLTGAGLLLIMLFPGCVSRAPAGNSGSNPVTGPAAFINTAPEGNKLVFVGVSTVLSQRQATIDAALEEAARRVAVFKAVAGEYSVLSNTGGRFFDFRNDSTTSLDYDQDYKKFVKDLEFDPEADVFTSGTTMLVRTRYPGSLPLNFKPTLSGKPAWVDNPPLTIGRYAVGVGYADRRHYHTDTVKASYENAIFAVLRGLYAVSEGDTLSYQGPGWLDNTSTDRYEMTAKGSLKGFYVLETWTDPQSKAVWTLGIAENPQNSRVP